MEPATENERTLLEDLVTKTNQVLLYEPYDIQNLALEQIPLEMLSENASTKAASLKSCDAKGLGEEDLLILELLHWFKFTFFSWVDTPKCDVCGQDTVGDGMAEPTQDDKLWGANHVEKYFCSSCLKCVRFPRYNHPRKLLETRRGRCGEWANCFTLLCRSLGYETRLVFDWSDHVWTEVYSSSQKRWLHCDPCENVCDTPLMYEVGWKKKVSYIIAFSKDEVQDVTWRYCTNFQEVMHNRTLYRESWLLSCLLSVTGSLQAALAPERKQELLFRKINELIEFLTPPKELKESEKLGRSSGSQAWRELRGEFNPESRPTFHIFRLSASEISNEYFNVKYSCAMDKYIRVSNNLLEEKNWKVFVYEENNIFRKVENDWNMAYLARKEGCLKGSISWKFDFRDSGLVIDVLTLTLGHSTFKNGAVSWTLNSEDLHIPLKGGTHPVIAEDLHGSIEFTLTAELTGGNGPIAWQHAQLFRQPLNSQEFPFEVDITFIPRSTAL